MHGSQSWSAEHASSALGSLLVDIYHFLEVVGKDVCIMTATYVQLNCRFYFFGSSFFDSGFGVGNLNESGLLSTPDPTCYRELVSATV
jgi:hypothetical protein